MPRWFYKLLVLAWAGCVAWTMLPFLPGVLADAGRGNPQPLVQFVAGIALLTMQLVGGILLLKGFILFTKAMEFITKPLR